MVRVFDIFLISNVEKAELSLSDERKRIKWTRKRKKSTKNRIE